jgi:hypothetical protein
MQDELIKSYMEVLSEGTIEETTTKAPSHEVKGAVPTGKSAFGDFKEGNESDENVDLETPEESEHNSDDDTGTKESTEKLDKSSFNNPFDVLYSKILGENAFSFSNEKGLEPSFDEQDGFGDNDLGDLNDLNDLDDMDEDDMGEDEMDEDDMDEENVGEVDLKEVLANLKDVLSELEKIVSDEDDEDEVDDIEDLDDDSEEDSEESDEDESKEESEEDEKDVVKEESWKEASARKDQRDSRKERLAKKKSKTDKLKKASKYDDDDEEENLKESVKVKGLKKGVNLKPFSGNIKKLQNKKAEVSENKPKAAKSKAQTPSTGSGFDGVLKKLSPTAGHNLTKASSHTVSGAVKAGKSLFEQ